MKRRITYLLCLFFIMAFTGYASEIKVLDAVSGIKDGEVIIAFIFDKPVDPKFIYDDFISIATGGNYYYKKGVIDPDKRVIYYTGFPSDKKFKVSVWQGFQGANGTVLEEDFSKQLTTPALKADAWFGEHGIASVRPENRKLEINISNLKDITVNYYAVPFPASKPFAANIPEALSMLTASDLIVSKSYAVNFKDKQGSVLIEPPEELFNVKGLYFAAVADTGGANTSFTAFLINDLNIHARFYPLAKKNNLAVWLRSDGEPLPEGTVRVFSKTADENSSSAVTDAFGKAVFTVSGGIDNVSYITAQKGTLSAALFGAERLNLSGYDTEGDVYSDSDIFIYGSKDTYLKNDTLKYYIMARGEKALKADKAEFILTAPNGGAVNSLSKLNSGYAEFSSKLESSAPAGEWKLTVKIGESAAERIFTVESPHKARLTLQNEAKTLLADNISALNPAVSGESDGSAAGGILRGNYRLKTVSHIKGYEGFSFGRETAAETFSFAPRNLNDGKAVLALTAPRADEQFSPVSVEYDLRLFERDAETARLVKEAVFLPAGEAAGIRYMPGAGESVFQIISLDASGKSKKTSFSCLLLKEDNGVSWSHSEDEGWKPEPSAAAYPLAEQNFETGDTPKEIKFRTPPGRYRLELKNTASAYARTFSFETGNTDTSSAFGEIKILLDKKAYLPGETLTAVISSPFDGGGQLLVEDSEGVLRAQAFTVTNGKGDVAFPINNRWKRQDIYITAFMYANAKKSKDATDMVFGITHLPIDRNGEAIRLEIQHPEEISSGKDLEVVVRASENFEGASVTLALIEDNRTDESVPNLDPEGFFSRRLAYMPVILDNSAVQIKKTENTGVVENTERFPLAQPGSAVVFANPVSFDKNGEARFKVKIPNNNGKLHLLALAFGQEAFGSESSSLK
jgi:uncharacterized protein YfaS (alpha-2-macroglobulin family)